MNNLNATNKEIKVAIRGEHGAVHYYLASVQDAAYEVTFQSEDLFSRSLPVSLTLVKEIDDDNREQTSPRPSLAMLNRINWVRGLA